MPRSAVFILLLCLSTVACHNDLANQTERKNPLPGASNVYADFEIDSKTQKVMDKLLQYSLSLPREEAFDRIETLMRRQPASQLDKLIGLYKQLRDELGSPNGLFGGH